MDTAELGLLIRTDFSNETAWETFESIIQAETKALMSSEPEEEATAVEGSASAPRPRPDDTMGDSDSDTSEGTPPPIFKMINPSDPQERALLTSISNLTALRLFTDLAIRPAPVPPACTTRIKPPNRLVDHHGWQEVYEGKDVWIYDARSNTDQSVRVVGRAGDMYGTAT